jgi:hypothetical protein
VRIYELLVINMRGLQYCPPATPSTTQRLYIERAKEYGRRHLNETVVSQGHTEREKS